MQIHIDDIREELAARSAAPPFDPAPLLRDIAHPRLTGTPGAAKATSTIRERFEALGYEVHDHDFTFNPWVGRFGITIAGVIVFIGGIAAAATLYFGHPIISLIILAIVALKCASLAFLLQRILDRLKWGQVKGKNLLVNRPGSKPHYLLVAHRDSKSQPLPLAFRGPAIALGGIAWLALVVLSILSLIQLVPGRFAVAAGTLAAIAGVLLIFCWVENNSPGALDNASGVATVLGVAERENEHDDVAFLITDAEELGLAGARAIARQIPPVYGIINFDGIDDHGEFLIAEDFGWPKSTGKAPHLAAALLSAAAALDLPARRRSVPFGIMLDHIPFVQAGTPGLTFMRGSLGSLRRVHRPIDDLEHMRGDGISRAVEIASAALFLLRRGERA